MNIVRNGPKYEISFRSLLSLSSDLPFISNDLARVPNFCCASLSSGRETDGRVEARVYDPRHAGSLTHKLYRISHVISVGLNLFDAATTAAWQVNV